METSLCLLTVWYCQLCYHGTSHSVCHHFSNHHSSLHSSLHSSRTIKKEKGMIVKWRIHIFSQSTNLLHAEVSQELLELFFSVPKKSKSQFTSADVSADFPPCISLERFKKRACFKLQVALQKKTSCQSIIFYIVSHSNSVFFCWCSVRLFLICGIWKEGRDAYPAHPALGRAFGSVDGQEVSVTWLYHQTHLLQIKAKFSESWSWHGIRARCPLTWGFVPGTLQTEWNHLAALQITRKNKNEYSNFF